MNAIHLIRTFLLIVTTGLLGSTQYQLYAGQPDLIQKTLKHDGLERSYYIYKPKGLKQDQNLPLVLALHGGGGRAMRFSQGTTNGTLMKGADQRGIILVFPQGIDRKWNDGRVVSKEKRPHDDVGFLSKVIDEMINTHNVDPKRVYATGISNGGFMSVRLAVELTDKIAAIAPVTAQLSKVMAKTMSQKPPAKPISVMVVNGTLDPLVPYTGGHVRLGKFGKSRGEIISTEETITRFVKHNGCKSPPTKVDLPDKDPDDQTRVSVSTYTGGQNGTEVVLVKVTGGGHAWPGGRQYFPPRLIGRLCRDIDASDMILDFFMKHKR